MKCRFGLDFPNHIRARISDMFSPYLVDWEHISFETSLAAVKILQIGNAMKVLKTWLNRWHSSSRSVPKPPKFIPVFPAVMVLRTTCITV